MAVTETVLLRLSEENARALSRAYDDILRRKTTEMKDRGWDKQGDLIAEELATDDLGTKVSRLLSFYVDGVEEER